MTPKDRIKSTGHGSLRKFSRAVGFHEAYVSAVLALRVQPSQFFIDCLNSYLSTRYTTKDFKQGPRRAGAIGSVSKRIRANGTEFFQVYFCQKYLGTVSTEIEGWRVIEDYKIQMTKGFP